MPSRPDHDEPPEGASHEVKLLYQGIRKVTRKSWVGTGPDGQGGVAESQVSTVELYDLQGRLYKVIEPEGLTAEYTYDTEDRLTRARLFGPTAQVRSFSYDPRGFLLSKTHHAVCAPTAGPPRTVTSTCKNTIMIPMAT